MKIKILLLLFLLSSNFLLSQEKEQNQLILKINATGLVDIFAFPTLQLSIEKKVTPYFSIIPEFGYQLYNFNHQVDTIINKPRGFKASIEGRFYVRKLFYPNNTRKYNGLFVGIQPFYRGNQFTSSKSYSIYESEIVTNFKDNFGVKKKAYGANLTIGYQASISKKKIVFEPYLGLGLMNRKVKNTNLSNIKPQYFDEESFGQYLNSENSNDSNSFNLCFGFRIGYKL